ARIPCPQLFGGQVELVGDGRAHRGRALVRCEHFSHLPRPLWYSRRPPACARDAPLVRRVAGDGRINRAYRRCEPARRGRRGLSFRFARLCPEARARRARVTAMTAALHESANDTSTEPRPAEPTVTAETSPQEWTEFVTSHPGSGYHEWEWRQVFKQAFGHD